MSRIFLSYARDDVDAAKQLAGAFRKPATTSGGTATSMADRASPRRSTGRLKNAEVVVVLWSEASVKSAWVQDEAAEGREFGSARSLALGSAKAAARLPPVSYDRARDVGRPWPPGGARRAARRDQQTCGQRAAQSEPVRRSRQRPATRKRSICVLPFVNMSGEPEQEYFSDGISEDIITDLSKVSALSVVARNTAFTSRASRST